MSLFIRELSLYKKVLTLSLRVWTSTTLSNSLSRGLSLFLRVQTLRYRVIESRRVLFFTVICLTRNALVSGRLDYSRITDLVP